MIYKTVNIKSAKLVTYVLSNYQCIDMNRRRPMIIICPGGGYSHCSDREAEAVAIRFNSLGYNCSVLFYSVYDEKSSKPLYPQPLEELSLSVAYIREHSEELNTDKAKIIVMGFSAGGHLAASLGVFWQRYGEASKPNALVLCYPVITSGKYTHKESIRCLINNNQTLVDEVSLEKQVSKDCPVTFIWTTREDDTVPYENSVLFAEALEKAEIKHELIVFEHGVHGLSLGTEEVSAGRRHETKEIQCWPELTDKFLTDVLGAKFIPADQL